ncbi:MAG TPA: DUF4271 domain-containing protein [Chitinophagales bacterium]|nr:DUF4271 domain-containing protein [Chitinophagales bacterium]
MIKKITAVLWLCCVCTVALYAQSETVTDTLQQAADTLQPPYVPLDSQTVALYNSYVSHKPFVSNTTVAVINDIQQYNSSHRTGFIFILLMVLLGALTYVKTAFSKQIEEMLQSIVNRNLSQQIFRTQSGEVSFADVLLNANFTIVASLYVRFFLVKYFYVTSLDSYYSVTFLIFLFTFFYVAKIVSLQFIGKIFELQQACDEYIFNFTTVCKTIGLTLLPALFVFYTASQKFFNFVFALTIFVLILFVLIFIWRALSTVYKLMYRSVYHFFIYVCVVEISSVFLFFKLLTKTII